MRASLTSISRASGRLLLSLALAALVPVAVYAQSTGSMAGVVADAATGETLVGANVILAGTTVGSTTDLDGRYEIRGVAPGTYDLQVSFIGFAAETIRGVAVEAGVTTRVDVLLSTDAVGLDEVVVEAEAVENTDAALLAQRAKAAAVSDAVSAEAIGRWGSATASDALEKVTGASVVDGKYASMRGLGDRYVSTRLNGAGLPSADPDRNAVPLDLFPAGVLENIVATKSFTPDMAGSFAGGSIDLSTKAFPDRFTFSFSSKVGYNTETRGEGGFLTYEGGGVELAASGTSAREIPRAWRERPADAPPLLDVTARFDEERAAELDALAKAFDPVMAPAAATAPADRGFAVSAGHQVAVLGRPLGFLAGITFDETYAVRADGVYGEYKLTGRVDEKAELDPQAQLDEIRGTQEVLLGGLGTLAYRPAPEHVLTTTLVYNQSGESVAHYGSGRLQRDLSANTTFETRALGYTGRMLRSIQLSGDHRFGGADGLRAAWTVARSRTTQDEPDLRFFASQFTVRERDGMADTTYAIRTSNYTAPSRYFRDLAEDAWDTKLDLELPGVGASTGANVRVKVGGAYDTRARAFREQLFVYALNPSTAPYEGDPRTFFSTQTGVLDSQVTAAGKRRFAIGNYIQNVSTPANDYDGVQDVYAAYGMVEVRPSSRLRVITGVRFEATRMEVASLDASVPTGRLDDDDWLPSLNVVYTPRERMNLRAAFGRTLARPIFREKAPYASFDFIGGRIFIGNPALRRTLVDNVDLRWEWFGRPGEVLAVSGFYKRLQNPIELAVLSTNNQVQYQNVDRAVVAGVELELRRRLDGLARLLAGFEVGSNVSLVHSRVDVPADDLEEIRALDPWADAGRPLQGQSPYVVNVDLTYHAAGWGTMASLLYNVYGPRLSEVSVGGSPDVYEAPLHTLDLVVHHPLTAGLRIKASARNLLDASYLRVQEYRRRTFVVEKYTLGRSFSVGVTYAID